MATRPHHGYNMAVLRPSVMAFAKVLMLTLSSALAAPLAALDLSVSGHEGLTEPDAEDSNTWVLFIASAFLVLTGGAFAGLTIALMGQDGIYLQVVSKDPQEPQQKNAKRVFDLLNKGKHWVLVTLLLSNVIVNESLPVVLDRCLGGGVAAVVGSTVLIVIFGEILPQSVCVRYGLQIGGYMSKPVLMLMYLMAPIAWPTAKLLDWILGEDHGTVYKKSGLKTLVTLHKSLGDVSERLNQDEVTIISAVLDLKAKPVGAVMTPMGDVFTLPEDAILDEKTMDRILTAGYSRIPIHQPGNPTNFVGMLLVRILITYDPEDAQRVSDFALATLPETRPETSCLDILNFFQEGKSHMVLVSQNPGDDNGALGVVTLEDVIEELIGEEIIDESDVYIDIHKAIRRLTPAPKARPHQREHCDPTHFGSFAIDEAVYENVESHHRTGSVSALSDAVAPQSLPKSATFLMRRSSSGMDGKLVQSAVPLRKNFDQIKEHLKHLGPSNRAANPKSTKFSAVKIKPANHLGPNASGSPALVAPNIMDEDVPSETTALLERTVSTVGASDGVKAVIQSYGGVVNASEAHDRLVSPPAIIVDTSSKHSSQHPGYEQEDHATQTTAGGSSESESPTRGDSTDGVAGQKGSQPQKANTLPRRHFVRSGSITENVVEAGGIRKMVLDIEPDTDEDNKHLAGGDRSPLLQTSRANSFLGSIVERSNQSSDGEGEGDESPSRRGSSPASHREEGQAASSTTRSSSMNARSKKNRRKKRKAGR